MKIDEMAEKVYEWYKFSLPQNQMEFKHTSKDDLVIYHHSLGRNIRNYFKLWENDTHEPEIVDGVDVSPDHPDAISMKVIEAVWDKIHKEK